MNPLTRLTTLLVAATLVGACASEVATPDSTLDAAVSDARAAPDVLPCREVGVRRINRAVPSPDGATVALATKDRQVVLVSASDGAILRRIEAHVREVYDVAYAEDGATLFSWGDDGVLRAWGLRDGALRWSTPHRSRAAFHNARLAVRGGRVAVGGPPAEVFDAATGASVLTLDHPSVSRRMVLDTNGLEAGVVAISPDGSWFAAAQGGTVFLFDREGRPTGRTLAGDLGSLGAGAYPPEVRSVTFSPEGDALLVATLRAYVTTSSGARYPVARLYRVADGTTITTLTADSSYEVSAAFSPDGDHVAVSAGGRVEWWTVRGVGGWLADPPPPLRTGATASEVLVDVAGRIVANDRSRALRVYEVARAQPVLEVLSGDAGCIAPTDG